VNRGYLSEIFVSFQGEGVHAGRRQLFIRLGGCNLRCRYCDTPDSLERKARWRLVRSRDDVFEEANPVSVEGVLSRVRALLESERPVDGVALTGGEPLLQAEFLALLLSGDTLPHPRLLETNGMLPDRLEVVLPGVDVVSMDIKIPSNSGEPGFWAAHARFLALARGRVYVKILIDPGTALIEVEEAARLVRARAPETPVFLQPITTPKGVVPLSHRALVDAFEVVRGHLRDVRVLPQTHRMLGVL
jgi:7-carboxy-7-deazaguanine synthase